MRVYSRDCFVMANIILNLRRLKTICSRDKPHPKDPVVYSSEAKDFNNTKITAPVDVDDHVYDHTNPHVDTSNVDIYDHTSNSPNTQNNSTDWYSSTNGVTHSEDIYDHTNGANGKTTDSNEYGVIKATDADDIYDHTQRNGLRQAGESQNYGSFKQMKERDEGIYDHTNHSGTANADNDYGIVK